MKSKKLLNALEFINETVDEETKERFELDDILYNIAIKIFDYRVSNGLTKKQLAEILGIKQAMVSKLESGEYNPIIEQLWEISKKLGWNFNVLLEEKDSIPVSIWDEAIVRYDNFNKEFLKFLGENA